MSITSSGSIGIGASDILRAESDNGELTMKRERAPPPKAEIGILLYRECQAAMVHGMTDLLQIAARFSEDHGGPPLRVSHWRAEGQRFSRTYDSHPNHKGLPNIVVVPGRVTGPPDRVEAAPYALWLRELHAGGATLAASCG